MFIFFGEIKEPSLVWGYALDHFARDTLDADALRQPVGDTADQILAADNVHVAGYAPNWGFGRHMLGPNFLHYIRDPWRSHAKLIACLEYIEANNDWVAGEHTPEDALYLWGPVPASDFITHHQIP